MGGVPQRVPRAGAEILASDADRDRAARALRRHYAAGRLGTEELEQRLAGTVAARTRDELASLFRDLPSERGRSALRRMDEANRVALRAHVTGFVAGNGALIGIWSLTGGGEFWPAWALVPTTGLLSWHLGWTWVARRVTPGARRRSAYRP
jgi:hypothetical protein